MEYSFRKKTISLSKICEGLLLELARSFEGRQNTRMYGKVGLQLFPQLIR